METDKEAETFSEALFTYLWFTENIISGSTAASTIGDMAEFIAEVAKAVVVLSALSVPAFNESMEEFFQQNDMSRRNVFTFLVKYCFDNHAETDDIFCVILNTCTFVYRLVIFCQHRGHSEYVELASMCWTEIFESDLKGDFYANGGWEQFHDYIISSCFVPKDTDTDHKAFVTFLDEINYLFPKLNISDSEEFVIKFSSSTDLNQCEHHRVDLMDPMAGATAVLLDPAKYSGYDNNSGIFIVSDDSGDENDEFDLEERFRTQLNPLGGESSDPEDDSDEELFQELVQLSLDSIKKLDETPASTDCIICQSNGELRTISCKDAVCLKHNPGYFYYLVTYSDV